MSTVIVGRSYQQQLEDEVLEMHSDLSEWLNDKVNGRSVFSGEQRKVMLLWKERCEEAIASGDASLVRRFVPANVNFAYYVGYSVFVPFRQQVPGVRK